MTASGSRGIWRMARRATEATSTKKPAGRAWTRSAVVGVLSGADHQALAPSGGGRRRPAPRRSRLAGPWRSSWTRVARVLGRVRRRTVLEVGAGQLEEDVVEGGRAQRQAHHRGARES